MFQILLTVLLAIIGVVVVWTVTSKLWRTADLKDKMDMYDNRKRTVKKISKYSIKKGAAHKRRIKDFMES